MLLASLLDILSESFFSEFTDSTVYFTMAAIGTILFLLRILLMSIGGDGGLDVDFDATDGLESHDGASFFSLLSILSFMMGTGWMGLACRREWDLGGVLSALIASAFGFALLALSSAGMAAMRKMNASGAYNVRNCIGSIGRVYMKIPAKGEGRGKLEITVDGRRKTLPAISTAGPLESFSAARVVEVQEGETLIVEPTD